MLDQGLIEGIVMLSMMFNSGEEPSLGEGSEPITDPYRTVRAEGA